MPTMVRAPSSAHRRSAITASTAATRCRVKESVRGDGFLADVVADWEAATAPAAEAGLRVVTVRTGIVQSARGGTLRLMRPLFAAGLGGRLGNGEQWLSWIGRDDLLDVYYRALYDTRLTGPSMPWRPSRCATPTTRARWPGLCTAPRWCRYRRSARDCPPQAGDAPSWVNRVLANSPRPIRGWFRPSCRHWATASGGQRSLTRWLTNSGTGDRPHVSGNRAPNHGFLSRHPPQARLCARVIRRG
jgi:hypothetical protein